jgi:AcrR family transcriptional regulator
MHNSVLRRKEKVIITAIEILDETGINGLTTKEIARRHNVSEPAIYKQFESKKDIVLSILDQFAQFDEFIRNTVLENSMNFKEGILYLAKTYAEYYQNYPEIATVMFSFDVFRYDEATNSRMKNIVFGRYELLARLIKAAVERGEVPENTDVDALGDTIFDVIWSNIFLWKMNDCSYELKKRVIKSVEMILEIMLNK